MAITLFSLSPSCAHEHREQSAAALFDMIEYYESAVNVLIGFNKNLGVRGWQAAAHLMRKVSVVQTITSLCALIYLLRTWGSFIG